VKHIRFVDTLGMVLPFLHACGWDDLAKRQLEEYDQALLQGVFPAHAYDTERQLPLGVFDWSRGVGWYILGLIETMDMEENAARIVKLANALLPFQREDGGFSCFIFNQKERMESSGTALIGLLFVSAYQITHDKRFLESAFRVEKSLMKATRRNGALDNCQGDTYGIGYYSQIFSVMPFAQGLALKLSKQLDEYV
jgi:unsaturated rhamnogalacturonyl hydrolase